MTKKIYVKDRSVLWNLTHYIYILTKRPIWVLKGFYNKIRYGKNGPQVGELIYINPQHIYYHVDVFGNNIYSGSVIGGDWDKNYNHRLNMEHMKYKACISHWQDGVPWDETDVFGKSVEIIEKEGHVDGYKSIDELQSRYKKLDELYNLIKKHDNSRRKRKLTRTTLKK